MSVPTLCRGVRQRDGVRAVERGTMLQAGDVQVQTHGTHGNDSEALPIRWSRKIVKE